MCVMHVIATSSIEHWPQQSPMSFQEPSTPTVSKTHTPLSQPSGSETARQLLSRLLQHLQVASVTDRVIRAALQSSTADFEDAVTIEAANVAEVEVIVTRNIPDFKASIIPAVSPEEFLLMPLEQID